MGRLATAAVSGLATGRAPFSRKEASIASPRRAEAAVRRVRGRRRRGPASQCSVETRRMQAACQLAAPAVRYGASASVFAVTERPTPLRPAVTGNPGATDVPMRMPRISYRYV
ncbi:hypothetical protein MYA_0225 [Burkholderia sp. KJ006]|nr:hypothetical protein MYA_0225 [Burkholderia sp. KJ006]